jgi:hypothetical protein
MNPSIHKVLSINMEGVEITPIAELDDLMSVLTTDAMTRGQFSDVSEGAPVAAEGAKAQSCGEKVPVDFRNFTWEHFFTTKCGVHLEDALKYEQKLIAHRMNPEDTLGESVTLVIAVGQIPVGDKLKIIKTIQRREIGMKHAAEEETKALEALGLGEYSPMEASVILDLGRGTDKDDIEYGIELWEEGKRDLDRIGAVYRLKNAGTVMPSKKEVDFDDIGAMFAKMNDPALRLLRSFGYETFDYTKGKEVGECPIPLPWTESQLQYLLYGQHPDPPGTGTDD